LRSFVGGIDEAGRGSLFGPLVIAGISIERERIKMLKEIQVKDSKLLSPTRRQILYPEILKIADRAVSFAIPPNEIDKVLSKKVSTLNQLEAVYMARIADMLNISIVYVDSADRDGRRFGDQIKRNMKIKARIVSRNHMDERNVVVSAASIIAKVERDLAISQLKKRIGDFGSGYPSDTKTRTYITNLEKLEQEQCSSIRLTWKTIRTLNPFLLGK
jgi:ribonuclease HII